MAEQNENEFIKAESGVAVGKGINKEMKKTVILFLAIFFSIEELSAQSAYATFAALQHEGKLMSFTGIDALKEAVEAAEDGDVITLSSGLFNGDCTITKAITLRGAGMTGPDATRLTGAGRLDVSITGAEDKTLIIEGIDTGIYGITCSLTEPKSLGQLIVRKCFVAEHLIIEGVDNIVISNCKIQELRVAYLSSLNCYNSLVSYSSFGGYGSAIFKNCIVSAGPMASYEDCVCYAMTSWWAGCSVTNTIYVLENGEEVLTSPIHKNVSYVNGWSSIFDWNQESSLLDIDVMRSFDYKTKSDIDPSIGIYAGQFPFSPKLDLPTIKSISVSKQTDGDGKLGIDVEIED